MKNEEKEMKEEYSYCSENQFSTPAVCQKTYDHLTHFITSLNYNFSVIALTETWLSDNSVNSDKSITSLTPITR